MSYAGNPMTKPTPNGFSPYELVSAMQKFIRRSMEREALYCFYELEAAGLYNVAANRLCISIYEDVGMANPSLTNSIPMHIEQMQKWYQAKNGAWRLVLGNIILQACRGQKTRIADHFVCSQGARRANGFVLDLEQYSDFVYDMHTMKGKRMGRGLEHFFAEGMKEVESTETTDYSEEELAELTKFEKTGGDLWEASSGNANKVQGDLLT
ncbi:MAG: hypothetical protein AB7F40_04475 [Victivallaceae bacterium]